ncbi:hypothetical protein [Luteimonas sp. 100069]|uniref:hypothetical protein n=1 Tax=Luteimonas sp. 100069 TaxID=2006109 RepID=UPI0018F5E306|nr:hypothetical protein [Luteimonas sp. 100069]
MLAFAAGAALQYAFGLLLAPEGIGAALHLAGALLADAGLVLVVWALAPFAWRRTTIIPPHVGAADPARPRSAGAHPDLPGPGRSPTSVWR